MEVGIVKGVLWTLAYHVTQCIVDFGVIGIAIDYLDKFLQLGSNVRVTHKSTI